MKRKSIEDSFKEKGLHLGRMIGHSKSGYGMIYPENLPIFNALIFDSEEYKKSRGKCESIWHGDLDLNRDIEKLYRISLEHGSLLITYENKNKLLEIFGF